MSNIQTHDIFGIDHSIEVFEQYSLQCTEDGANKFWKAVSGKDLEPQNRDEARQPYVVILRWGRIGTEGQSQVKRFRSDYLAMQYVNGRLKDKKNKNYVDATGNNTVGIIAPVIAAPYVETEWDLL